MQVPGRVKILYSSCKRTLQLCPPIRTAHPSIPIHRSCSRAASPKPGRERPVRPALFALPPGRPRTTLPARATGRIPAPAGVVGQKGREVVGHATLGVVGLGNMGRGVANNIHRAGYELAVWDVAARALRPFEGKAGVSVLPPAEMARRCAAIFLVVPGSGEIEAMLRGRGGILANARRGLVLYDLTTSHPIRTKRLAAAAARRGVAYLDAGMSGGATGAETGTLTLMIGGDAAAYGRTRKYLAPFTQNLFYLGASGAGHTLKLIHNMVCHTIFLATCEGGRMAARAGIRLENMIAVFNVSNARSYASQARFPRHILSGKWDARSRIYNLHKDVGMAVSLAGALGADASLGKKTLAFLKKAVALGMREKDFALLYRDFEKIRRGPRPARPRPRPVRSGGAERTTGRIPGSRPRPRPPR